MTSRRTVLKSLLAFGGAALGGLWVFAPSYQAILEQTILSRLSYLKHDGDSVKRFIADYEQAYKKGRVRVLIIGFSRMFADYRVPYLSRRLESFEEFVLERYLRSTDFFLHGADESRVLRYVAFADPYQSPCFNPFAKLV